MKDEAESLQSESSNLMFKECLWRLSLIDSVLKILNNITD